MVGFADSLAMRSVSTTASDDEDGSRAATLRRPLDCAEACGLGNSESSRARTSILCGLAGSLSSFSKNSSNPSCSRVNAAIFALPTAENVRYLRLATNAWGATLVSTIPVVRPRIFSIAPKRSPAIFSRLSLDPRKPSASAANPFTACSSICGSLFSSRFPSSGSASTTIRMASGGGFRQRFDARRAATRWMPMEKNSRYVRAAAKPPAWSTGWG
mmetsp:Transcript_13855/g.36987  ORF Transcript_13855/g.36987 Transcript_13855/m.36987 type:complete len:215 (+) Transcript_13855:3338-3982(+)